jgi:hypothetical protein
MVATLENQSDHYRDRSPRYRDLIRRRGPAARRVRRTAFFPLKSGTFAP